MKIAEALIHRSDAQKKLSSLTGRISENAIVSEGMEPTEDANELVLEAVEVLGELHLLIRRINITNASTNLTDGRTIAEVLEEREVLKQQHSLIQNTLKAASRESFGYRTADGKWAVHVDVKALRIQLDDLCKQIRKVNVMIQEANWKTDLE